MTATASYDRDTSFQRQQTKSNEQGENKQTRTTMKMHKRTSKTNTWTNIEEKTNSEQHTWSTKMGEKGTKDN